MKVICSWCKKELEEKESLDDDSISHGCCSDCKEGILRDLEYCEGESFLEENKDE